MTLLLLAGTGEARALARWLAARGVPAVASLAGATRAPGGLDLPLRMGGFGGEAGFRSYLAAAGITAVLDVTHPFAFRISARTARVCQEISMPYRQFLRPEWQPAEGDLWHHAASEAAVAPLVPKGATVFLATGPARLDRFAALAHAGRLICRRIDAPEAPFPFSNGRFLVGRPPFTEKEEIRLFKQLRVDLLVTKNAGGAGGWPKLAAARVLRLPVVMIARPPQPDAPRVQSVAAALDWVGAL